MVWARMAWRCLEWTMPRPGHLECHYESFLWYGRGWPGVVWNGRCRRDVILNVIMSRFYGMGEDGLALSGMDDAGEMSSWYVFNAIGLYPYSPAEIGRAH